MKKNISKKKLCVTAKREISAAENQLLDDLFDDFYKRRKEVYKMNFLRGLFFGLGSVIGGTVVVFLLVWILGLFVDFPGIGDNIGQLIDFIKSTKK